MIQFQALVKAIHQAIENAADIAEARTKKYINSFFDEVPNTDKNSPDKTTFKPKVYPIKFPRRNANTNVSEDIVVEVPAITLAPTSVPQISEVKFSTDLEVTTDDDGNLLIAFPQSKSSKGAKAAKAGNFFPREPDESVANARIEITLTGAEPPEGLKKLIEGYERALRAQIPG